MALTYASYLQVSKLLDLQTPQSDPPEHDEMLFIVIHQVYELWFKLLLHELEKVERAFRDNDMFGGIHTLKRSRTIMKTLVAQLDVLETMTPASFSAFRDRLDEASGFQSMQFRELEFFLGRKNKKVLTYYAPDLEGVDRVKQRLNSPSLVDAFYVFLGHHGVELPQELAERPVDAPAVPNEKIQDALFQLSTEDPRLNILFELMMDFDEGLQEWRYRHVKMVERTIGNKMGTGGSKGVEFLKKTLFQPVFHNLWAIRQRM